MGIVGCIGCTWVGLGWGRDSGSAFLDLWDHKLYPTRVPLCVAPWWWFHCWAVSLQDFLRPGEGRWSMVLQWNHQVQTAAVSLTLYTRVSSPGVEVVRGKQPALVSSGDAGKLAQEVWGSIAQMIFPEKPGPFHGAESWDQLSEAIGL